MAGRPPAPTDDDRWAFARLDPARGQRPPDWRWQLALRLASGRFVPDGWADGAVRGAVNYLLTARAWRDDLQRRQAISPATDGALRLHQADPPHGRWQVEARALAGQTDAEIAARAGLDAGTVVAYLNLFFDIRDRLSAPAWVLHSVIGLYWRDGVPDVGVAWRHFAYFAGPAVLDELIAAFHAAVTDDPAARSGPPLRRRWLRAAALFMLTPVTPGTALRHLRLRLNWLAAERAGLSDEPLWLRILPQVNNILDAVRRETEGPRRPRPREPVRQTANRGEGAYGPTNQAR